MTPRPLRGGVVLLALAACTTASIAAAPPRFTLAAEASATQRSLDGRFVVGAQAQYVPTGVSHGGRFTLKVAQGAPCEPFADPLFADGFETP